MNNDLISRSAVLEELKVQRGIERIKGVATINMAIDKGMEIAIRSIVSAPAVDAVEVVRCEDCKFWNRHIGRVDNPNGYCRMHEETMNSYDFCSYGERRTE